MRDNGARSNLAVPPAAAYRSAPRCSALFFCQAEDGIRDRDVTGVQTCALPIWFESFAGRAFRWQDAPTPEVEAGPVFQIVMTPSIPAVESEPVIVFTRERS